ncbi:MAG: fibronectin type III-like domain-contianing protein [Thermoflexibacteraceae bacterium]
MQPIKRLVAFKQIEFEVGQTQKVEFELTEKELGFYHADRKFYAESGLFEIMVGTNSEKVVKKAVDIQF